MNYMDRTEVVARAFCKGMGVDPDSRDENDKPAWQDMTPGVLAVIDALEELLVSDE